MRIYTVCLFILLVSLIQAVYIPHPRDPHLFVPVRLDTERPNVRLRQVMVEEPPDNKRLLELLILIFALPLLFTGVNGGIFGNRVNGNGNGNGGGVVTEDPCC